jgi:hypothetical protein
MSMDCEVSRKITLILFVMNFEIFICNYYHHKLLSSQIIIILKDYHKKL